MDNNVCRDRLPAEERYSKKLFVYRPPIFIKDGKKYFYRFSVTQRVMHIILFTSVFLLIFTGVPLKYADAPVLNQFYSALGGTEIVPIIHRYSGVVMCGLFIFYIFYAAVMYYKKYIVPLKKTEKLTLKCYIQAFLNLPMVPDLKDAKDIIQNFKYLFFISDKKPKYSKFMWKEKFDFFAVFWGIPVLGISGLLLWKRELLSQFVPGVAFNLAIIAHSDEALLAATFLVIVHLYNVHLHLHKFPMGMVFLTGYLSEREMIEEHYAEYVRVMNDEGLSHEIKPFYESHHRESISHKIIKVFYSLSMMGVLIAISWVVLKLTVFSIHGFLPSEDKRMEQKMKSVQTQIFEKRMLESQEREKHYLGYRIVEEQRIKGHFHHIGFYVMPDKRSACIMCHGDLPHEKFREVRAFLNMHASFLACEVCHAKPVDGEQERFNEFQWYSKKNGALSSELFGSLSPEKKAPYKIIPLVKIDGKNQRVDTDELLSLTKQYIDKSRSYTPQQKTQAQRVLHKFLSKEPAKCRDCHTQDTPYLPYAQLGYTTEQIKELRGTAIIGMLEKYERFYFPELFKPKAEKKESFPWLRAVR